jgi:cell division protein FtsB
MPSASQRSTARNARSVQGSAARLRAVSRGLPKSKLGWDRKFRAVMLVVFALTGWIAVKAGLAMYSAHQQATQESSLVNSLRQQNRQLEGQKAALSEPGTIMNDARHLGMVRLGERAYAVTSRAGN